MALVKQRDVDRNWVIKVKSERRSIDNNVQP